MPVAAHFGGRVHVSNDDFDRFTFAADIWQMRGLLVSRRFQNA